MDEITKHAMLFIMDRIVKLIENRPDVPNIRILYKEFMEECIYCNEDEIRNEIGLIANLLISMSVISEVDGDSIHNPFQSVVIGGDCITISLTYKPTREIYRYMRDSMAKELFG